MYIECVFAFVGAAVLETVVVEEFGNVADGVVMGEGGEVLAVEVGLW